MLLKSCASFLTYPLHHLFSLSLRTSAIPSEWKFHTITPIFKSGNKSNVKNYRPISLLSNTSKVLERIVYNQTLQVISDSITHTQFGFCKHKSTLQQLLLYFNELCSTNHPAHSISPRLLIKFLIIFSLKSCGTWVSTIIYGLGFSFTCLIVSTELRLITAYLTHYLLNLEFLREVYWIQFFIVYINDLPTSIRHSKILN